MPKHPISLDEFERLPHSEPLRIRQFVSTEDRVGPFPFCRSHWWALIRDGVAPQGQHLPGRTGRTAPRFWTKQQVLDVVAKLEERAA